MQKPLRHILKVLLTFTEVVVCNQITCLSMQNDHPIDLSNRTGWSFFYAKTLPTFIDMIVYVYRPHASYAFPSLERSLRYCSCGGFFFCVQMCMAVGNAIPQLCNFFSICIIF